MAIIAGETNYFGLDIGSSGIRAVQLRKSGAKPYLVTYGNVVTPAHLTTSDAAGDAEKVSAAIAQLVSESGITTKNVVAGLPTAKLFATVITTPSVSDAELAKAIKFQAEQVIPMAIDQVRLDYAVIDKSADGKTQDVLLVAAPNTVTQKYLQILEKAGLEVMALESNATALARAVVASSASAVILLDLGDQSCDISIVHNGGPKLLRSVSIGTSTFVKLASQNLGLDEAQAQQFTYKFGLTSTQLEGRVLKAVKTALDELTSEIQKSIQFFAERYPQVKLEKIILAGGASALPEFPNYLANSFSLPVEIGNPWMNVSYPAGEQEKLLSSANIYGVASGLAQRMLV